MLGSLGSCWENEVQSPVCSQEKYLLSFLLPIYMGEQRAGGEVEGEERVNSTLFLFYGREKLRTRGEKLGAMPTFPRY